jgi:hypothetical protein
MHFSNPPPRLLFRLTRALSFAGAHHDYVRRVQKIIATNVTKLAPIPQAQSARHRRDGGVQLVDSTRREVAIYERIIADENRSP